MFSFSEITVVCVKLTQNCAAHGGHTNRTLCPAQLEAQTDDNSFLNMVRALPYKLIRVSWTVGAHEYTVITPGEPGLRTRRTQRKKE